MKNIIFNRENLFWIQRIFLFLILISCSETITGTIDRIFSTNPPTVKTLKNLKLEQVTSSTATVSWMPAFDDDGIVDDSLTYEVSAFLNEKEVVNQEIKSGISNIIISNLTTDTPYKIVVEAQDIAGNITDTGSIWVVPSPVAINESSKIDDMLTEVIEISNTLSNTVEVVWEQNNNASIYVAIVVEDKNELAEPLAIVKGDRRMEVVCNKILLSSGCAVGEISQLGKIKYEITNLKAGIEYTIAVLPITFRDLVGLRGSDELGQKITLSEGIKELIKLKELSGIGYQIIKVSEELLKSNIDVGSKTKVFSLYVKEVLSPLNLSVNLYKNEIHVSWDHSSGATYYQVMLTNNTTNLTTNVYRSDASQLSKGNMVFYGVADGTYDIIVTSFSGSNQGGFAVNKDIIVDNNIDEFINPQIITNLKVTNDNPGVLTLSWNTEEVDSLTGYHIYYYKNDYKTPSLPNYLVNRSETNLVISNVSPGNYVIRVDSVAEAVLVKGISVESPVYTVPDTAQLINLKVVNIENIDNKLYHSGYAYEVVVGSPGGPIDSFNKLSITYTYQIDGGEWKNESDISDDKLASFEVEDVSDPSASFGKVYNIKTTVKNPGGFESISTKSFIFRSFAEPVEGDKISVSSADRQLVLSWPIPEKMNSSEIASYRVVVSDGLDNTPGATVYTNLAVSKNTAIIDNLINGKLYTVRVFPESAEGWSVLSALKEKYQYPDSTENYEIVKQILSIYDGVSLAQGTPIGKPNPIVDLVIKATSNSVINGIASVSWSYSDPTRPADEFVIEYLKGISGETLVNSRYEIQQLDWDQPFSLTVYSNDIGSYVESVTNLNTESATNVFRVKAKSEIGESEYVYYALKAGSASPPSQVKNITVSLSTTNSFTLSWQSPANSGVDSEGQSVLVTGYKVSWRKAGTDEFLSSPILDDTTLSYTVNGLEQGSQYEILIQAKNGVDNYNTGDIVKTWTLSIPGSPGVIVATVTNADSVELTWTEPSDSGFNPDGSIAALTGYQLEYSTGGVEWTPLAVGTVGVRLTNALGTETSVTVVGLAGNTDYSFRVSAINTVGVGANSAEYSVTTLSAAKVPAAPGEIIEITENTNSLEFGWAEPTDPGLTPEGTLATITGYRVEYSNAGVGWEVLSTGVDGVRLENEIGLNTSAVVIGLTAGTEYSFRVSAFNYFGVGVTSKVRVLYTASASGTPGHPGAIVASVTNADSLELVWTEPINTGFNLDGSIATITGYRLEYSNASGTWIDLVVGGVGIGLDSEIGVGTTARVIGLTGGTTYGFRVSASNDTGLGFATEAYTFTTAFLKAAPGAPGVIVAAVTNADSVELTWTEPSDSGFNPDGSIATLTGYQLEYSTGGVEWTPLAVGTVGVRLTNALGTETSVAVVGLAGNTDYSFRVSAINIVGVGVNSAEYSVTTLSAARAPVAPGEIIEITENTNSLEFGWAEPTDPGLTPEGTLATITGYRVEYSNAGVGWEVLSTGVDGVRLENEIGLNTSAVVIGLTAGTEYSFRVSAFNYFGVGVTSKVRVLYTASASGTPGHPGAIVASVTNADSLELVWTEPINTGFNLDGSIATITGYRLEYSNASGTWIDLVVGGVGIGLDSEIGVGTTAKVIGLTGGTTYGFRVSASNDTGLGFATEAYTFTTASLEAVAGAPGVIVAAVTNTDSVELTWTEPSNSGLNPDGSIAALTGYQLEYSTGGGEWTPLAVGTVGVRLTNALGTETSVAVVGLAGNTDYSFRVSAINIVGVGVNSAEYSVTTLSAAKVPGSPGVIVAAVTNADSVELTWTEPSDTGLNPDGSIAALTGYQLEYSTGGVEWTTLAVGTVGVRLTNALGTETSVVVVGLAGNTDYSFRVSAINTVGVGVNSAEYAVTTLSAAKVPAAPGEIIEITENTNSLEFAWTEPTDPGLTPEGTLATITGYRVEYSNAGVGWEVLSTGVDGVRLENEIGLNTSAVVIGLTAGTEYSFRVSAFNYFGVGVTSEVRVLHTVSASGTPGHPGAIVASVTNADSLELAWTEPINTGFNLDGSIATITGYRLEYSNASGTWIDLVVGGVGIGLDSEIGVGTTARVIGLTGGTTYGFRVSASNDTGLGFATEAYTFTTASLEAVAGAPGVIVAAVTNADSVELTWTEPSDSGFNPDGSIAALTGYQLEYSTGGVEWTSLAVGTAGVRLTNALGTETSVVVVGLAGNTDYSFRVSAINIVGVGVNSAEYSVTTLSAAEVPVAPGVIVAAVTNADSVELTWTEPADTGLNPDGSIAALTGYQLEYSTGGGEWTSLAVGTAGVRLTNALGTETSVVVVGLAGNTDYSFRVSAINIVGVGVNSAEYTVTTLSAAEVPVAPGVIVAAVTNADSLELTWSAPTDTGLTPQGDIATITGYQLEYSTGGVEWTSLAVGTAGVRLTNALGTETSVVVVGLAGNTDYSFRVSAINIVGVGVNSAEYSVTTLSAAEVPVAPGVIVAAVTNADSLELTWSAPTDTGLTPQGDIATITGYQLEYSTGGGEWTSLAVGTAGVRLTNALGTETSVVVVGLAGNTDYSFRVSAINIVGVGVNSAEYSVTTLSAAEVPVAPGVIVAAVTNADSVELTWTEPADTGLNPDGSIAALTGYQLEYSTGGVEWTPLAVGTVGVRLTNALGTETSVAVVGLVGNTDYSFRVSAINTVGVGVNSAEYSVTTLSAARAPVAPGEIIEITENTNSLEFAWTEPTDPGLTPEGTLATITGYRVEYSNAGVGWEVLSTGVDGVRLENEIGLNTSAVVIGLTAGTEYSFRVSAFNYFGVGVTSEVRVLHTVSASGTPGHPGAIVASVTNADSLELAWTEPINTGFNSDGSIATITGYRLEYSNASGTWIDLVVGGVGIGLDSEIGVGTTAKVIGLTGGTTYGFRVSASNDTGLGFATEAYTFTTASLEAVAGAPGVIVAAVTNADSVELTWTEPSDSGLNPDGSIAALTGYQLEYSTGGGEWTTLAVGTVGVRLTNALGTETGVAVVGLVGNTDYSFRVSAINIVGVGTSSAEYSVTTLSAAKVPGAPGAIVAAVTNADSLELTWSAPTDTGLTPQGDIATITGYQLEYSTGGVEWTSLAVGTAGVRLTNALGTETSVVVVGLAGNTDYSFRVSAINIVGVGVNSAEYSVTTLSAAEVPVAPGVIVAAVTNADSVELTWTEPADTGLNPDGSIAALTGYQLEYSTGGGEWTSLAVGTAGVRLTNALGTETSVVVVGLAGNTDYSFRVSAINIVGVGVNSAEYTVTTLSAAEVPVAPGVIVAAVTNADSLELTWSAPTDTGLTPQGDIATITGYQLEYSTGGVEWTSLAVGTAGVRLTNALGTETSVVVVGLAGNTDYSFRVSAINTVGVGVNSAEYSVTTLSAAEVPVAPGVIVAAVTNADSLELTWSAPTDTGLTPQGDIATITGYQLEYSTGGGEWTSLAVGTAGVRLTNALGTETSVVVVGLAGNTDYSFRVSAINIVGVGVNSAEYSVTTLSAAEVPVAPGVIVAAVTNADSVELTWTEPADTGLNPDGSIAALTGYQLEYSTGGGEWTSLAVGTAGVRLTNALGTETSVVVVGLAGNTDYSFRVSAINTVGVGVNSAEYAVTTLSAAKVPVAPEAIVAAVTNADSVELTWTEPSDRGLNPDGSIAALTGYQLEYSTGGVEWTSLAVGTAGVRLTNALGTETSVVVVGLAGNTDYSFRVSAINTVGVGVNSAEYTVTTLSAAKVPGSPGVIVATVTNADSVELTWTEPSDRGLNPDGSIAALTGYQLEYSTGGVEWTPLAVGTVGVRLTNALGTETSVVVVGLAGNTDYSFRVSAINIVGVGDNSAEYSVTTLSAAKVPAAPGEIIEITENTNSLEFGWAEPTDPGLTPEGTLATITGYRVEYSNAGVGWEVLSTGVDGVRLENEIGLNTSAVVIGLTAGTEYSFRVSAFNYFGVGVTSEVRVLHTVSASGTPGHPGAIVASVTNADSLELVWTEPINTGFNSDGSIATITGYRLEYSNASGTWIDLVVGGVGIGLDSEIGIGTTARVIGLTGGTTYGFRVSASNDTGLGFTTEAYTFTTASLEAVPGSPGVIVAAVTNADSVELTWTEPSDRGLNPDGSIAALTGYQLEYSTGGVEWTTLAVGTVGVRLTNALGTETSVVVVGLAGNTDYSFRVSAINTVGVGVNSAEYSVTTLSAAKVPGSPGAIIATATNTTSVELAWSAPTDTGLTPQGNQAAITGYVLEYDNSGVWTALTVSNVGVRLTNALGTETSVVVVGLAGNTDYSFRVSAINTVGVGTISTEYQVKTLNVILSDSNVTLSTNSVTATAGIALSGAELPIINIPVGANVTYSALSAVSGKDLGGVTFNQNDGTFSIAPSVLGMANYTVTVTGDGVTASGTVTLNLEVKSKYVISAGDLSLPTTANNGNRYIIDNNGSTSSLAIYDLANSDAAYLPLNTDAAFTHPDVIKTLALRLQTSSSETVSANPEGRVTVGSPGVSPGDMVYIMVLHEDQIFNDRGVNYQLTMKNYISTSSSSSPSFNGFSVITATGAAGGSTFKARTLGSQTTAADKTIGSFTIEDDRYISIAVVSTFGSVVEFDSIEIMPVSTSLAAVPSAPETVSITGRTATSMNLSWNAPANQGYDANGNPLSVSDYKLEYRNASGIWTELTTSGTIQLQSSIGTGTTATVEGLTDNTTYNFRVRAVNSIGTGPSSSVATATTKTQLTSANVTLSSSSVTVTAGIALSGAELPTINIPAGANVTYSALSAVSEKDLGGVSFNSSDATFSIAPSVLGMANYKVTVTGDNNTTFGEVTLNLVVKSKYVIATSDLPSSITPVLPGGGSSGDWIQFNSKEDQLFRIAEGEDYIPDNDRTTPFSFTEPLKWFAFKNNDGTSDMITANNSVVTVGTAGQAGQAALIIVINKNKIMNDPVIDYTATIKGFNSSVSAYYNGYGIVSGTGVDDSVSKAFANDLPVNTGDTTTGTFKLENETFLSLGFVASGNDTVSFEEIEIMPVSTSLAAVPTAPEAVSITGVTGASMDLSWNAPAKQGYDANGNPLSVSDYKLEYSDASGIWTELTTSGTIKLQSSIGTETTATVEGLTDNTTYNFRVKAVNSAGTGPSSSVATATTKIQLTSASVTLSSSSVTVTAGIALSGAELPTINIPAGANVTYSTMSAVSEKDLGGVSFNPSDATFSIAPSVLGMANYTITVTGDDVTTFGSVTLNLEVKSKYVITADDLSLPSTTESDNVVSSIDDSKGGTTAIYSLANGNRVYLPLNTDAAFTHTEKVKTLLLQGTSTGGLESVTKDANGRVTVGSSSIGADFTYIMILHEDQIFDDPVVNYQVTMKNYRSTSSSASASYNGFSVITATGASGGSTFKASTSGIQTSAADKTIGSYTIENGRYVSIAVVTTYSSVIEFDSIEIMPVSTSLAAVPSAPEAVSITGITGTSMDLSWNAPANEGYDANGDRDSVSGYTLEYSDASGIWTELTTSGTIKLQSSIGTGTTATVEGLTGSTTYNFRVRAVNSAGTGPSSSVATAITKIQLTSANVTLSSSSVTTTAGSVLTSNVTISVPVGANVTYSAMSAVSGKDLGGVSFNQNDVTFSIIPATVLGMANYTVTVTGDGVTTFGSVTLNLEVKSKYVITADDLSLPITANNGNRYIRANNGSTSSLAIYDIANRDAAYLPLNENAAFTHPDVIKTLALRLQTSSSETVSANSEGRVTVGNSGVIPGDMVYIMVLHEDQIFDDSSINYQLTMKNYRSTSSSSSPSFNGFSVITATGAAGGSTFKARTYGSQTTAADKTIGSFTIEDGKYISIAVVSTFGSVVEFDSIEIIPQ